MKFAKATKFNRNPGAAEGSAVSLNQERIQANRNNTVKVAY